MAVGCIFVQESAHKLMPFRPGVRSKAVDLVGDALRDPYTAGLKTPISKEMAGE